jgi:secondary thiamine-phosphate synthase enzyme
VSATLIRRAGVFDTGLVCSPMPTAEFTLSTDEGTELLDVTDRVADGISDQATGICTVFVEHTTAGVVVQEAEARLLDDLEEALAALVPDDGWRHDEIDDNAAAHVRATLLGEHVTVPVSDGTLDLGTWQSVLFVECDGPRRRSVTVITD